MSESREPFHEGERAVQRTTGEEEIAQQNGVMIGATVTARARPFLQQQRMLVVASRDIRGRPWASILFGGAGFVSADDDGGHVTLNRSLTYANDGDILWSNLTIDAPLGLLAIELSTRRRLRINGRLETLTKERLALRVDQSFSNCPKYIQRRSLGAMTPREDTGQPTTREGQMPDGALTAAVAKADTVFVASGHPTRGLDASHRGGMPGFIQILGDLLRIPDYAGNSMFNTLGNLQVDARCGLALLDFQVGRVYQMTGEAILHLNPSGGNGDSAYTGRYWDFRVRDWRSTELPVQAEWQFVDYSPYNPP